MTNRTTVFMFSGQGSHYYQMGRELYDNDPGFRRSMLEMDTLVRDLSGQSVVGALYDATRAKSDPFESLSLTLPAIFMVEFALAQTLISRGITPDCTLGVSAGAFAAAVIAGCLSLEAALTALVKQAREVARCPSGGMIAVVADPAVYRDAELSELCDLAAVNFASNFVVAAPRERLERLEEYFGKRRIPCQRLAVGYAFHSRWIDAAREALESISAEIVFRPARIPVVCCALSQCLRAIPAGYFWTVAREPIMLARTVEHLEQTGVRYRYIDAGPAGSLATSLKYVLRPESASEVRTVLSPFGYEWRNLELLA